MSRPQNQLQLQPVPAPPLSIYAEARQAQLFNRIRPWLAALALSTGLTAGIVGQSLVALAQTPVGGEFRVNTTTGNQHRPSVGMDANGDFIIVWEDRSGQDGSLSGIFAQQYSADGMTQGSEFQVNITTTGSQNRPSVGIDVDGNFVIAWTDESGQDGDKWGIFARRYNMNGMVQGSEFQVNITTTDYQISPSVGMSADGDFVIAWTDEGGQDGGDAGIFAQRYSADGTIQGGEFQVNTTTSGNQRFPKVGMDADGDFVIGWHDYSGQDGDGYGIFARRYNADGIALGSEFQVNTTTTDYQLSPSVGMNADGDFVIAWTNFSEQNGDGWGISAQRYNADGTAEGSEFQVNSITIGNQGGPIVGMDADGDFVIAWRDYSG